MKPNTLTFESVARLHMAAEPDRQQAGLRAWAAALRGDAAIPQKYEPLLTLKGLSQHPEIALHPTMLWKLEIKAVAESLGGRPRYRVSRAIEYLKSPACAAVRAELRRKRRAQEGRDA